MVRGTLPVLGILAGAARAPIDAPTTFAKAFAPMVVVELAAIWASGAGTLWHHILDIFNTMILATIFCTNWHRHLILGASPRLGWGQPETRYLIFSIMLGLVLVLPSYMAGAAALAGFEAVEGTSGLALAFASAVVILPAVTFALMVALSVPMWLWLPSEAIGRDESHAEIVAMARGNRGRLFLVVLASLALVSGLVMGLEWAGAPEAVTRLLALALYPMQVGVMSLAYLHLDGLRQAAASDADPADPAPLTPVRGQ